jgi:hypothetical protein
MGTPLRRPNAIASSSSTLRSALTFSFFAFMYSLWFVPWSVRAASWHLGLSVITVAVFGGSLSVS